MNKNAPEGTILPAFSPPRNNNAKFHTYIINGNAYIMVGWALSSRRVTLHKEIEEGLIQFDTIQWWCVTATRLAKISFSSFAINAGPAQLCGSVCVALGFSWTILYCSLSRLRCHTASSPKAFYDYYYFFRLLNGTVWLRQQAYR